MRMRASAGKASDRLRGNAEWLREYEARVRAVGIPNRPDDGPTVYLGIGTPAGLARVRLVEDRHNPRAELLEAARAGDRDAVDRADALYDGWRQSGVMRRLG